VWRPSWVPGPYGSMNARETVELEFHTRLPSVEYAAASVGGLANGSQGDMYGRFDSRTQKKHVWGQKITTSVAEAKR